MHILRLKGKPFAVGLKWYQDPGPAQGKSLRARANRIVQDLNLKGKGHFDAFSFRKASKNSSAQLGFAASDGLRVGGGVKVLLPSLTDSPELPLNWIGRFPLDDGFWIVGVSKGQILFHGDQWCRDGVAAERAWAELLSMGSWAQDEQIVCESVEQSLEFILPNLRKAQPLQSLVGTGVPRWLVRFGILFLFFLFVWWGRSLLAPPPSNVVKAPRPVKVNINELFPPIWNHHPSAVSIYGACEEAIDHIPLRRFDWEVTRMECSGDNLKVSWKRGPAGTLTNRPYDAPVNLRDHASVISQHAVQSISGRVAEGPGEISAISIELMEIGRIMGGGVHVEWAQYQTVEQNGQTYKSPYRRGKFTITSALRPDDIVGRLSQHAGVVISKLGLKASGNVTWFIEGEAYVR
jgi:hypothetical protein